MKIILGSCNPWQGSCNHNRTKQQSVKGGSCFVGTRSWKSEINEWSSERGMECKNNVGHMDLVYFNAWILILINKVNMSRWQKYQELSIGMNY